MPQNTEFLSSFNNFCVHLLKDYTHHKYLRNLMYWGISLAWYAFNLFFFPETSTRVLRKMYVSFSIESFHL
jgi:hypothetical protein